MSDAARLSATQQHDIECNSLFMWRGHGIVLIGHYSDGSWVLARGWVTVDAMEHVRRWNFGAPESFAGQVRRLVAEATGNQAVACDQRARALAWTSLVHETA